MSLQMNTFNAKEVHTQLNIEVQGRVSSAHLVGTCDVWIAEEQGPLRERKLNLRLDLTLTESEARDLVQYFGQLGIVYQ